MTDNFKPQKITNIFIFNSIIYINFIIIYLYKIIFFFWKEIYVGDMKTDRKTHYYITSDLFSL